MLEKFTFITLPLYPVLSQLIQITFRALVCEQSNITYRPYSYSLQFFVLSTIDKFLSPKKTGEEELPQIKKCLPDNLEKKYLLRIY